MTDRVRIGVAGGGLMGCGIATQMAVAGHAVRVFETDEAAAGRVPARCAAILDELVAAGALDEAGAREVRARIELTHDVTALSDCGTVFEAIREVLPEKHALYARLEPVLAPGATLASTTSGFTPEDLARPLDRPDRFLVAHFWNPPHIVPLVEVLTTATTRPEVLSGVEALLRQAGCEPVRLKKAVPGFIGNRLQFAVLREALHLLREGVADAETIDRVMKLSIGKRYAAIGPLEGADVGGLETFLTISRYLMPELAKTEDVLDVLQARTDRGERGRASGQGFYTWDAAREDWLRQVRLRLLGGAQP